MFELKYSFPTYKEINMILLAFGTRPEYIKIKPIINEFNKNNVKYKTLFTGQHKDLLKETNVDYEILIHEFTGGNRLNSIISSILDYFDTNPNVLDEITHVLIQGDTTSVLAVGLAAFHNKKKIIHLEAGLRTYDNDNPYPEEQNRRLVSQIADIHLCPTIHNKQCLLDEKINGDIYVVGNTVLDNLLDYKCIYGDKILITLHRRENHEWLDKWFIEIEKLAEIHLDLEFIIPLHPNPNVQKHRNIFKYVNVIEPLSHSDLLDLLAETRLVITDSGGLQEECSFLNKKCLTCRKVTERPEAINQSTFMVESPNELFDIFNEHISDYEIDYVSPFGDGTSAKKITEILMRELYG